MYEGAHSIVVFLFDYWISCIKFAAFDRKDGRNGGDGGRYIWVRSIACIGGWLQSAAMRGGGMFVGFDC